MAQVLISAAVGAATFVATGGNFAAASFAFGATSALFGYAAAKKRPDGPSIGEAQVTTANYGEPLPYVLGAARVAGGVEWQSAKRTTTSGGGGGKGGGGRAGSTTSYSQDVLFGLTSNPKTVLLRIWMNGKLVWSAIGDAATTAASNNTDLWSRLTFYSGAETQLPDPTYSAAVGAANAPAYRGRATVFIEGLQLGTSGQLPNLTFEVADGDADAGLILSAPLTADSDDIVAPPATDTVTGTSSFGPSGMTLTAGPGTDSDAAWVNVKLDAVAPSNAGRGLEISVYASFVPIGVFPTGDPKPFLTYTSGTYGFRFLAQFTTGTCRLWFETRVDFVSTQINFSALTLTETKYAIRFPLTGTTMAILINDVEVFTWESSRPNSSQISLRAGAYGFAGGAGFSSITFRDLRMQQLAVVAIEPLTLRQGVEALSARAGMPAGTYDAAALDAITKPLRSVVIGQVGATRATLEQLMGSFFFKAAASDKVYFAPIPTTPSATLTFDEIGCGNEQPQTEALPLTMASELELPPQVSVRYVNVSNDYQAGTETSDRLLRGQKALQTIDFGIGMTPSEAKAVADANLIDAVAGLMTGSVSLDISRAALEPGDVVQIPRSEGGSLLRFRLGRRSDAQGVLSFELRGDDAGALVSAGTTDTGYTPSGTVTATSPTTLLALDIPLLRDADDAPGYYVAAKPTSGTNWPSAQAFSSINNVDFTAVATIAERAIFGTATTVLPTFAGGYVMDEVSRVTVNMGEGELASTTRDGLFADETINVLLLGNELVRFVTATLSSTAPNIYVISRMLRGQKGTEWAMSTHAAAERAVLLRPQGLRRVTTQQADVGALRHLKGVTSGQALSSATAQTFTNTGVSQRPLAPVDIRGAEDSAQNVVLTWRRRSRFSSRFLAPTGVPLAENSEAYTVRVYTLSPLTLRRTFNVSGSASVTYTRAQQMADSVGAGTLLQVDVAQISAAIGEGRIGTGTARGAALSLPQVATVTLGGTFQASTNLMVGLGSSAFTYTTLVGDATLAGASTSLAAVIDADITYAASPSGNAVVITGQPGVGFSVSASVAVGDNSISAVQTQAPSAGVPQIVQVTLSGTTTVGYTYRVTLNGVNYSHVAVGGNTMTTVAASLATLIDSSGSDPFASDVILQIEAEGANGSQTFTDSSSVGQSLTAVGSARCSTDYARFGSSSLAVLTSSPDNHIRAGAVNTLPAAWASLFATGLTIDGWMRIDPANVGGFLTILSVETENILGSFAGFSLHVNNISLTPTLELYGGNIESDIPIGGAQLLPPRGQWFHFAAVWDDGKLRLFIDGQSLIYRPDGAQTYDWISSTPFTNSDCTVRIGASNLLSMGSGARMDRLRVTKAARYTGSYASFFTIGSGVPPNYAANFVPERFTVTSSGAVVTITSGIAGDPFAFSASVLANTTMTIAAAITQQAT